MRFPLEGYAADIGMSGWEWERRVSLRVGFDLDSILGHADGLPPEQLDEVVAALRPLPYIELRRSTRGKGFHVYVPLAEIPTVNHVEHAILAKAVLAKISTDTGRDFSADVDAYGAHPLLLVYSRLGGTAVVRATQAERPDLGRGRSSGLAERCPAAQNPQESSQRGRKRRGV